MVLEASAEKSREGEKRDIEKNIPETSTDNSWEIPQTSMEDSQLSKIIDIRVTPSIKDFAYDISDPRHFGIYDNDDSDDGDDNDDDRSNDEYDDVDDDYILQQGHSEGIYSKENLENYSDLKSEGNALFLDGSRQYGLERDQQRNDHTTNEILHAIALYPFVPENSNELPLVPDQVLIINYECGDGWLVAHDPQTGQTGLVPSEYIQMVGEAPAGSFDDQDNYEPIEDPSEEQLDELSPTYQSFVDDIKDARRFMPEILNGDVDDVPTESLGKLSI
ncbi:uncharacterized protein C5L36_0B07850 [Pichia kudriavzevii]|uniref:NAP1-binding protein 2 n=1 Tax=Pichia kudriavzevii TaxID=4909 RepID=A0A099P0I0_PICKU|nr:uncharacterized protein C5L36_0B07850 [Pichia kudriavzevii]AWU75537.1 hypothetical protein C5L36_0B07850 [Pichia kudriavzevii]KGK38548.1 hypothetical protein JL09_g2248 [Pichia kudriavzevii]ONH72570.1 NAP1-binding protein 2 [Pichia kudriavzevii]